MNSEYGERYKIKNIVHIEDEDNIEKLDIEHQEECKKAFKALGLVVISAYVFNFGIKSALGLGGVSVNFDNNIIAWTITVLGGTFTVRSIVSFFLSLSKISLIQNKIDDIQYWLQEEQKKNKSRSGR